VKPRARPAGNGGRGLFDHNEEEYPMKNTLMFLMVSLLLAFSLTACGGDSQQAGGNDGAAGQTDAAGNGSGSMAGTDAGGSGSNGSSIVGGNDASGGTGGSTAGTNNGTGGSSSAGSNGGASDDTLADDARDVLDDAGDAIDRAVGR